MCNGLLFYFVELTFVDQHCDSCRTVFTLIVYIILSFYFHTPGHCVPKIYYWYIELYTPVLYMAGSILVCCIIHIRSFYLLQTKLL